MDPNLTNPAPTGAQPNNPIPASTSPPQNNIPSSNINPALTQDTSLPWTQNTLNPEVVPKTVPLGNPQVPAPSALVINPAFAVAADLNQPPSPPPARIASQSDADGPPPAQNEEQFSQTVVPPQGKKFPVLLTTILVVLTVTGFSSSYLYFRAMGKTPQNQIEAPLITPPITLTPDNSATASADYKNPFDNQNSENPFSNESEFQNPFGEDESVTGNEPYQNPFDPSADGLTPTP